MADALITPAVSTNYSYEVTAAQVTAPRTARHRGSARPCSARRGRRVGTVPAARHVDGRGPGSHLEPPGPVHGLHPRRPAGRPALRAGLPGARQRMPRQGSPAGPHRWLGRRRLDGRLRRRTDAAGRRAPDGQGRIDRPVAAKLIEHSFTTAVGAPLLVLFLAGTAIGVIVLAVATWRAGFPRPAVVLLVLFPVVDSVAKGHAGTVASHVVLLIALGWFATALRPLALAGRTTWDRDMAVSAG